MLFILLSLIQNALCENVLELRMPGVPIPHNDTYYHMQTEITNTMYITGYRAQAQSGMVHHMLLYGCRSVKDRATKVWMGGPPCEAEPKILWSWALDAPEFNMPTNVSMEVGNSDIKFLVMELHYKVKQPETYKDKSGVDIVFKTEQTKYQAGIYLFMAEEGTFPPGKKNLHLDLACNYTSPEISVFAYRTHAHNYATRISGYLEQNSTWYVVGSRDPRLPEMFVRTQRALSVKPGDKLYARCEYDTTKANKTISIGNTHLDEMCNLYLMYYIDRTKISSVSRVCTHQQDFILPREEGPWWEKYASNKTLMIVLICLIVILVGFPLLYCCKSYFYSKRSYYKRPNDGFEKLFTPDEDDEEDEILYKSYKHSY